jgi:adenylylsulfate kinase-like enzyme
MRLTKRFETRDTASRMTAFLARLPAMAGYQITHLKQLESESIRIIREVAAEFEKPVMLYSMGKDSTVLLHLARKAFFPGPLEVYLTAPIAALKSRDKEGMYAAAERGELPSFPGVTSEFEEPLAADLTLDTSVVGINACAARIIDLLQARGVIH